MYTLHAQGEILTFATMGEFLYHLNQAQETFADLSQMSLEYKNVRYPIGRNQGTRGIFPDFSSDPMSAFFWLHIWLNEVLPFVGATAIPGLAVAPHLITRPNWGAVSELSSVAYGTYRVFSQQQRCASGNLEDWFRSNFLERFGYGHNGPSYDGHDQNSRHEVHVCYALARGDYVPEEVVAEYLQNPELVRYDSKWFRAVLEKPFLRGRFKSIGHLRDIVNIVGADNLTVENVPAFVAVLGSLPAEARSFLNAHSHQRQQTRRLANPSTSWLRSCAPPLPPIELRRNCRLPRTTWTRAICHGASSTGPRRLP